VSDWLKTKWAFITEAFLALLAMFFYERNKATTAEAKNTVADAAKTDAVLEAKQQDVQAEIKKEEAAPPPAPKTLDELARDLND
jgi:hypothetical protein